MTPTHATLIKSFLASIALWLGTSCPVFAITANLSWTGDDKASLTGSFTGTDNNNDDLISTTESGEITAFSVTFKDDTGTNLITYDLRQLQGFLPAFNFTYNIATGTINQSGESDDITGFSIGVQGLQDQNLDRGALFDTTNGKINFSYTDMSNFDVVVSDLGGIFAATATPVPFETSDLPVLVSLGFLGTGLWLKRKRNGNTPLL